MDPTAITIIVTAWCTEHQQWRPIDTKSPATGLNTSLDFPVFCQQSLVEFFVLHVAAVWPVLWTVSHQSPLRARKLNFCFLMFPFPLPFQSITVFFTLFPLCSVHMPKSNLSTKHYGNVNNCTLVSRYSRHFICLKRLSHEIFRPVFWPVWIYLGLNGNRFSLLNFKEGSLIFDSYFKYLCVSCQTFSEICRISEKDWQLSSRFFNFSLFWVSGPPRNAANGVNTSRRFVESPRMIDNLFRGSPRLFFNNISVSLIQLSILLGGSTNLQEGLVWNASILKIIV